MRETSMRGQVLAMSVDHAGVSASSAPNTSKTREGEVEDEQSIENLASAAKSAFEITSVTTAADDELETSMVGRHPMSADAELLKGSGVLLRRKASGESQDNISISEDLKVEAATGNKSETSVGETIENSIAVSDADTKPAPGVLASHSQTHIQGVVGGNGPNVQQGPSRFKRVNNYVRGRWYVRDTSEPEERPESSEMLKQMGPKTIAENSTVATVSPSVTRRSTLTTEHSETHQHSRTSSDVGQSPPVPAAGQRELREGGGGGEGDSSSDRDAHLDRNSTAADTLSLSRTTSFSSIATAGEQKSIDGDEHLRDTDNESVASSIPGGTTPELREPATPSTAASQSSQTATVSVASVPAATGSTAASSSTQEHPQNCTCESCSEREKAQGKRVATALLTLNQELKQLLHNNTQLENLKQQNDFLSKEREKLRQENMRLQEDNSGLQKDVSRLKHDVSQLQLDKKRLSEELQKLQQQPHLRNIVPSTTASVSERFESPPDST